MSTAEVLSPPPVVKTIVVALEPRQAFELFTRDLARWWPLATHSCSGADAATVAIEEHVGGLVLEMSRSGARHLWGTVQVWEPPQRFAMSWHPSSAPDRATALDVTFSPAGDGCRIHLVHSGWERRPESEQARSKYDQGWDAVLARYLQRAVR